MENMLSNQKNMPGTNVLLQLFGCDINFDVDKFQQIYRIVKLV